MDDYIYRYRYEDCITEDGVDLMLVKYAVGCTTERGRGLRECT